MICASVNRTFSRDVSVKASSQNFARSIGLLLREPVSNVITRSQKRRGDPHAFVVRFTDRAADAGRGASRCLPARRIDYSGTNGSDALHDQYRPAFEAVDGANPIVEMSRGRFFNSSF